MLYLITESTHLFRTTHTVIVKSLNDFCHYLHILCRILTIKFMYFINCYATWSFISWLKQVMVTWVQPRHQGSLSILCIYVHFLYMSRVSLFTFGKCKWTPLLRTFTWLWGSLFNWWDKTLKKQLLAPPTSDILKPCWANRDCNSSLRLFRLFPWVTGPGFYTILPE